MPLVHQKRGFQLIVQEAAKWRKNSAETVATTPEKCRVEHYRSTNFTEVHYVFYACYAYKQDSASLHASV